MKPITTRALAAPLLVAFLFAGLFAGAAHAQARDLPDPGMLPDHPLYFAKSISEGVGTLFTFGEVNEAERALKLSEKRLAEARALAVDGKPEEAEKALERYEAQLDRALTRAAQARANGDDVDDVLSDVSEATSRHQAVLAEVYEKVPEQARPGIERAMEASQRGHAQANQARSGARGRPDAPGRPDSAGPPHRRGQGTPGAPDTNRPGADDRPDRGRRGPPDSVETGRPDSAGGR